VANRTYTRFIEDHIDELLAAPPADHRAAFFEVAAQSPAARSTTFAGAKIDASDPLAVLHHGKSSVAETAVRLSDGDLPAGALAVRAPMQGTVIALDVHEGDAVRAGQRLLIMEAMKMEHVVAAPSAGVVQELLVAVGDAVFEGHVLVLLEPAEADAGLEDE